MPNKAYLIVYDGKNILIGQGGKSGSKKVERQGYHLPGGSFETDPINAVIRELKEETGIDLNKSQIEEEAIQISDSGFTINFYIANVDSVETLVDDFERPDVTNPYDEPFESLLSLISKNSWENENFCAKFNTDWFKLGLTAAKDRIDPQ
ncbi:NUDIX domain-containing protein [Acinetobacter sp. C26M]|uniref:NUDIX domain-containing protein n=1 Tax=unclassified Acinetobacter TaxID=196816 RepID=UPI002036EC82|nr:MULTISPECIES: NUDIX domain-containing protein [unclassified Acinetobacter]USA45202.1 NUDIX domain-containing protein [Acinetobacter sp. C26M]USA48704.1 NUDIX domain-containing protein [Acinetobacter sp. C26G]